MVQRWSQETIQLHRLGQLKKHLGIWYEYKKDENGDVYIKATMPKMVYAIIDKYEQHVCQSE